MVDALIKYGDLYFMVANGTIVGRVYVPQHCTANCNQLGCSCSAVEMVNYMSVQGKVYDISRCQNSLRKCIEMIYRG